MARRDLGVAGQEIGAPCAVGLQEGLVRAGVGHGKVQPLVLLDGRAQVVGRDKGQRRLRTGAAQQEGLSVLGHEGDDMGQPQAGLIRRRHPALLQIAFRHVLGGTVQPGHGFLAPGELGFQRRACGFHGARQMRAKDGAQGRGDRHPPRRAAGPPAKAFGQWQIRISVLAGPTRHLHGQRQKVGNLSQPLRQVRKRACPGVDDQEVVRLQPQQVVVAVLHGRFQRQFQRADLAGLVMGDAGTGRGHEIDQTRRGQGLGQRRGLRVCAVAMHGDAAKARVMVVQHPVQQDRRAVVHQHVQRDVRAGRGGFGLRGGLGGHAGAFGCGVGQDGCGTGPAARASSALAMPGRPLRPAMSDSRRSQSVRPRACRRWPSASRYHGCRRDWR